jgi:acyl-CoA reductase-like NAD-dependent aldehyde dehydrogenase
VLVERSVHDEVVARLAEQAQALRVGPPLDEATDIGALVSREQLDRVLGYVRGRRRAGRDGARRRRGIRLGGTAAPTCPGTSCARR